MSSYWFIVLGVGGDGRQCCLELRLFCFRFVCSITKVLVNESIN